MFSRIIAIESSKNIWKAVLQVNTGTDQEPEWVIFTVFNKEYISEEVALDHTGDLFQDIPIVNYGQRILNGEIP